MNILPAFTARRLPGRKDDVKAIVIHTTGNPDLNKVLDYYKSVDGLQPHYVIDVDGTGYQIAAEDKIAYHCKIEQSEAGLYRLGWGTWSQWTWKNNNPVHIGGEFSGYRDWKETWFSRGILSPLELITGSHPNFVTVGIELLQPEDPTHYIFTEEQYRSLARLISEVGQRHGIALERTRLLGHSDISPMRRCNAVGGWDPGKDFSWNLLFDLLPVRPVLVSG